MVKSAASTVRPVVEARAKRPVLKLDVGLPSGDATHRFVHAHLYYPRKMFGVPARCTGSIAVTPEGEERGFTLPIRFSKNREPVDGAAAVMVESYTLDRGDDTGIPLALMNAGDPCAYAFSSQSYLYRPTLRHPDWRLAPGAYRFEVTIESPALPDPLTKTFVLRVPNGGVLDAFVLSE